MKSKKGDLPDMLIFIITIFVFAIGLLIMAFVIPQIADGLVSSGMNSTSEAQSSIDNLVEFGVNGMQRGFLLLFTGLVMSLMITSFLIRTHPIFVFLYVIFLGITVFVGTYLGNAFEQLASSPALADTFATQGLISIIMQNLVVITIVVGALSMIIIFAKFAGASRNEGGGF